MKKQINMRKKDKHKTPKYPRIAGLIDDDAREMEDRIKRIEEEFRKGFEFLQKYEKAATIFGTARSDFSDGVYEKAEKIATLMAKDGFAIITGGGPGVMEAANKGAHEAGGESVGINIELGSDREKKNDYVMEFETFHYFFSRKVMLSFASQVYFFLPGGFGTLDEFFEITVLVQTGKIDPVPIILVDREYWTPLLEWIEKTLYKKNNAINQEDMDIYILVDTPEEAYRTAVNLLGELNTEMDSAASVEL